MKKQQKRSRQPTASSTGANRVSADFKDATDVKRTGRPTKTPKPATRVSLGLKVTPDIKMQIDAAARASGRTQSQEAEMRLEQSFRDEALLFQVLEMNFGTYLCCLLLMIGKAMNDAGRHGALLATRKPEGADNWFDNPYGFDQAERAAHQMIDAVRPEGAATQPDSQIAEGTITGPNADKLFDALLKIDGVAYANVLLDAIRGHRTLPTQSNWAEPIRDMLGPRLVDRIKRKSKGRSK